MRQNDAAEAADALRFGVRSAKPEELLCPTSIRPLHRRLRRRTRRPQPQARRARSAAPASRSCSTS
ncbi:hypothetical protein AERO9AM_11095 [Aeromicrobium sp. 9AM]|nr:hypothetical protein AERO9AM_11095 [Aeromicrobium sp. 9AM]